MNRAVTDTSFLSHALIPSQKTAEAEKAFDEALTAGRELFVSGPILVEFFSVLRKLVMRKSRHCRRQRHQARVIAEHQGGLARHRARRPVRLRARNSTWTIRYLRYNRLRHRPAQRRRILGERPSLRKRLHRRAALGSCAAPLSLAVAPASTHDNAPGFPGASRVSPLKVRALLPAGDLEDHRVARLRVLYRDEESLPRRVEDPAGPLGREVVQRGGADAAIMPLVQLRPHTPALSPV